MTETRPLDPAIAHEIEAATPEATLTRAVDSWLLTMDRRLRQSPARVWAMLTEPDQLARWSPVVPDRVLDSVGPAVSRENPDDESFDTEVLICDPPHELVHRWGGHLVRWTLVQDGDGTLLGLQQTFADDGSPDVVASRTAAGWHVCLAVLAASYDDHVCERVVGSRAVDYGWARLRDAYAAGWVAS